MAKRKRQEQFEFPNTWGGRREGAGRKPKGEKAGVAHGRREEFAGDWPLHVALKVMRGFPSLRREREQRAVLGVVAQYCDGEGFRVVHYSILGDHVQLVVEARGHEELRRGVSGLCSSIARKLNELWGRHGKVMADRFFSRLLRTPTEVRNVLKYVLHNARNHGFWLWDDRPDPCSSGECFDGWEDYRTSSGRPRWLGAARTWLLRGGWRRAGAIRLAWD
jgi:hypothetical protein